MKRVGRYLLVAMLVALPLMAQATEKQPPAPTAEELAQFSDNVLVPSPGELFNAMDKIGEVDWSSAALYTKKSDYNDDYVRAMNLGVRAADGFIALQAKDKENFGQMVSVIFTLAEELGVSGTVLDKGQAIEDLVKQEDWVKVNQELNKLRDSIKAEMEAMDDKDKALVMSAAAWVEGLRAVCAVLDQNYDEAGSSILYQKVLVQYFTQELGKLESSVQDMPQIKAMLEALPEIGSLIDVGPGNPISQESVAKLLELSTAIIQEIEKG